MAVCLKPSLTAIAVALCLMASTGQGQWVTDSIDCGGPWVGSLVYNSRANVIYGASEQPGIFFAISCDSNKVISSIHLRWPLNVAYASTPNKAYCSFYNYELDSVLVVDGSSHTRIKAIPLHWATYLVWDSISNQVYVSCLEENRVSVIDCVTDSVVCHIPVGNGPIKMYLNTRHRKLYVNDWDGEAVSIIDLETNQLIRTIPVGGIPSSGCYCAGEAQKYYCNGFFEAVVIDGVGDSIVARIPLSNCARSMVAVDAHELVMVGGTTGGWDSVFVIDAVGDSVLRAFPVGKGPSGLVWSPVTDLVYTANVHTDDVSVIAGDGSGLVLWSLPVGNGPDVFAVVPRHERLYLSCGNMVYVIRDRAGGIHDGSDVAGVPRCLLRARPSHFVGRAVIEYCGAAGVPEKLAVYAQDGRLVRRLSAGAASGERRRYVWDGRDGSGNRVPRGVYTVMACGASPCRTKIVKLE